MKRKLRYVPEILWFCASCLTLSAALHKTWYFGFNQSIMFYSFFGISIVFFFLRRNMRLKSEKQDLQN